MNAEMHDDESAIVLGAAQLGMAYGIANASGKPSRDVAGLILDAAWKAGIRMIDTAQAYGDSEQVIGSHLSQNPLQAFKVVSKLSKDVDVASADAIHSAARRSGELLGKPIAALLLHDANHLVQWPGQLRTGMMRCIEDGVAESLGVSIYTPQQFRRALEIPEMRMIQAPFNALDRRLLDSGLLDQALASGRTVVLRSVFLQGLMVLDADSIPATMQFAIRDLSRWQELCAKSGLTKAAMAIRYVRSVAPRAKLVMGCERPEQVLENAALAASPTLEHSQIESIHRLPVPAERVVNPAMWGNP